MAFTNHVLKVTPGALGPSSEGVPVFAARIDDRRLEYYDPTQEGRSNELRTLLAAALAEDAAATPLTPDKARQQADARIRSAREQLALSDWKDKIMGGLNCVVPAGAGGGATDALRLNEFLKKIATPRTRDEYDVEYELVFLGISSRSLIHRRMQQRYSALGIFQATCKISGGAVVGFPEALYPISGQMNADGRPRFPAGAHLYWNALDGVPCDQPRDAHNDPYVFRLGRIVAVNYHSVTIVLYPQLLPADPALL